VCSAGILLIGYFRFSFTDKVQKAKVQEPDAPVATLFPVWRFPVSRHFGREGGADAVRSLFVRTTSLVC
jgi:hypothetical protein